MPCIIYFLLLQEVERGCSSTIEAGARSSQEGVHLLPAGPSCTQVLPFLPTSSISSPTSPLLTAEAAKVLAPIWPVWWSYNSRVRDSTLRPTPFNMRSIYWEGISQCLVFPVFHFGIRFGGRRDLGLGSRADQSKSLDSSVDSRVFIYFCTFSH